MALRTNNQCLSKYNSAIVELLNFLKQEHGICQFMNVFDNCSVTPSPTPFQEILKMLAKNGFGEVY